MNIRQFARSSETSEFDKLAETAQNSIENNEDDFYEHFGELRARIFQILWRQDWFVVEQFSFFANSPNLFSDQDRFEELVHIGKQLIARPEVQDLLTGKRVATVRNEAVEQLRQIVAQLMDILRESHTTSDVIPNILKKSQEHTSQGIN